MHLKICGLRQTENIKSLLQLQPDYIGFIFYQKSKRCAEGVLDVHFIKNKKNIKKTGVFVNEDTDKIKSLIEKYQLNAVQLHGDEPPARCEKLKLANVEIIKAFSVHDHFDFAKTKIYEEVCDLFLFDTKGDKRGGNGVAFDWSILKKYNGTKPFFLSGGIGPGDAGAIKKINHPQLYGVDINSRFETQPGRKNVQMVKQFFMRINQ